MRLQPLDVLLSLVSCTKMTISCEFSPQFSEFHPNFATFVHKITIKGEFCASLVPFLVQRTHFSITYRHFCTGRSGASSFLRSFICLLSNSSLRGWTLCRSRRERIRAVLSKAIKSLNSRFVTHISVIPRCTKMLRRRASFAMRDDPVCHLSLSYSTAMCLSGQNRSGNSTLFPVSR